MAVTFLSKNTPSVTFLNNVATTLLQLMGHSGKVPSALFANDVEKHLNTLKSQLTRQAKDNTADDESEEPNEDVSLSQRAAPLIALMEHAIEHGENVSWEEGGF